MFAKILRWLTISVGCIGLFLFITPNGFVKLLAIEDTQVYKRNASEDRYKTYTESTMWNVSNEKQQSPNNVLVGVSTSTLNNFIYQEEFTSTTFKASARESQWDTLDGELRLELRDDIDQISPAVAAYENGDALVVWHDYRDGVYNVYAQRMNQGGDTVWSQDVRVNTNTGFVDEWTKVQVVIDSGDNAYIVWHSEYVEGIGNAVYAQRLDRRGNRLWLSDLYVAAGENPDISFVSDSQFLVVWNDNNYAYNIYAQMLDDNGSFLWLDSVHISGNSFESQTNPVISPHSSEDSLIVWTRTNYDSGYQKFDVYAQKINSSGMLLWGNEKKVNGSSGSLGGTALSVVLDDAGYGVVFWSDDRDPNDMGDIFAQRLDPFGERFWDEDKKIISDTASISQYDPEVVICEDNNLCVVWRDSFYLYLQKLDENGNTLWMNQQRVNVSHYYASSLALTITTNQELLIVWSGGEDSDIFVNCLNLDGNHVWAEESRVNENDGSVSQDNVNIAIDVNGNKFIVWIDNRTGDNRIHVMHLDENGNPLWPASIEIETTWLYSQTPAIAVDDGGRATIVWYDSRSGSRHLYAQQLDGNGNRLWLEDSQIDEGVSDNTPYHPAISVDRIGNVIVVWEDYRNGNKDIYAQKLNSLGNRLWGDGIRVNSDTGTSSQGNPAIAAANNGTVFVVWEDSREGQTDLYWQQLLANGGKGWNNDYTVSVTPNFSQQMYPDIAVDSNNQAVIVWEDWNYYKVLAQRFDINGNPIWVTDIDVTADTEGGNGGFGVTMPVVSIDSDDNAIIAWQHYPRGNLGTYVQKLDFNGVRLWSEDVEIRAGGNSASGNTKPKISVDNHNYAFIIWTNNEPSGSWDIYLQKLNMAGSIQWIPAQNVIAPDYFYHGEGFVSSKSVDEVTLDITQANLTSTYQANGGEAKFYLTNNGGTNWQQVTLGVTHLFTTTGSDLRWKAELTADPLWPRTPVINSLQIEYSTDQLGGDDYELDDTCNQAKPAQLNGAAQQHTFHQYQDSDWIWFDGHAGTTYTIQTSNTGPKADTVLELYGQCGQPPNASDDNAFGPGATLTFSAPTTGRYYIRVLQNDPSVYGNDTEYDLSVRAQTPIGAAVIVAGRLKNNDTVQPIIEATADLAYQSLLQGGLSPDNILYLSTATGRTGVDGLPTEANVRDAIQNWARTRVGLGAPLWLYLADHGNIDRFHNEIGETLTAAELNLWLSNLEATSGVDQINIVIDTCYSGSFIDTYQTGGWGEGEISGQGRIIVSSTSSRWFAYAPSIVTGQPVPLMYFSDGFWNAIGQGQSIWSAFLAGRRTVEAGGQRCGDYDYSCQRPWLDDTGDAWFDETDGLVAQTRGLNASFGGGSAPYIDWLTVDEVSGGQAAIRVQVRDDSSVERVWARIFAPSFTPPETTDGSIPEIEVPEVELVRQSGDVFAIDHAGFTETGAYQVVVYAQDDETNVASPRWVLTGGQSVYLPLVVK